MVFFNSCRPWVLISLGLSAALIYQTLNKKDPIQTYVDRIVEVEKIVEVDRVVNRTATTETKITKPDGTIVESRQRVETDVKEKIKTDEKVKERVKEVASDVKTRYRLGVDYLPSMAAPTITDVELRAGVRLGDLPLWLESGFDVKHRQMSIGVAIEF